MFKPLILDLQCNVNCGNRYDTCTVMRVLAFHQFFPGTKSRHRHHMWVQFVVPCAAKRNSRGVFCILNYLIDRARVGTRAKMGWKRWGEGRGEWEREHLWVCHLFSFLLQKASFQILQVEVFHSQLKISYSARRLTVATQQTLANHDTRIWLTVTPPCKVQQASDETTNYWNMSFCILWLTCKKKFVGWPR